MRWLSAVGMQQIAEFALRQLPGHRPS
eukprot:COSAG01_NODE_64362_length_276_cov_9.830508_1_plen_26_part_01